MPELPEVETVRRDLASSVVGLRVHEVVVDRPSVVEGQRDGAALLAGLTIRAVARHGKQLAVLAGEEGATPDGLRAICIHLGMTGQLLRLLEGEEPAAQDHVHVRWRLRDKAGRSAGRLLFRDPRRFGGIWTYESFAALRQARWSALGPDAIDGSLAQRLVEFKSSSRPVKAVLLDQSVVAGIGNIYADEALFGAGIRPTRRMSRITGAELSRLAECVGAVLGRAIVARGSTLRDYRGADGSAGAFQLEHAVYGRAEEACRACGATLRSKPVAQRTTVWCPSCQR